MLEQASKQYSTIRMYSVLKGIIVLVQEYVLQLYAIFFVYYKGNRFFYELNDEKLSKAADKRKKTFLIIDTLRRFFLFVTILSVSLMIISFILTGYSVRKVQILLIHNNSLGQHRTFKGQYREWKFLSITIKDKVENRSGLYLDYIRNVNKYNPTPLELILINTFEYFGICYCLLAEVSKFALIVEILKQKHHPV